MKAGAKKDPSKTPPSHRFTGFYAIKLVAKIALGAGAWGRFSGGHVKALRRQALLLALAHGQQRLLQMARQARGVKQRAGAALLVQALAQGGQLLRMRGQAQGQGLVFIGRLRDEFGQAHGVQQAGGHAACEAAARLREHGQASPEGIAGSRAGIERQGVQKQVGQAVAGQVVGVVAALGKDEPIRSDTAPRGLLAQIGAGTACSKRIQMSNMPGRIL